MSFGTNEPSTPECYDEDVHFAKKLSFARNDVVAVSYRPDNALAVCMHTSFDETSVAHSATDNVFWYEKRDTSLGDLTATPHRLSGGEWVFVSIHGYTFVGEGNCIGTDNLPGPHIFEEDILSSDVERCKLRCDEESLCTGLDTFLGKCRIFTGEIVSSDVSSYFGQLCFRKVPGTAHMVKTKLLQTAPESMKVSIVAVEAGYVSENSNAYSDTANACPNGFLIEPNTITSGDVWASSHGITTLDGCGQACTAVSSCHAFEWGGATSTCRLKSGVSIGSAQTSGWTSCKKDERRLTYRGMQSKTITGNDCQRWTAQAPHEHTRTPTNYPNRGLGDHAYCRNPDDGDTIWCYTTSAATRWEYCSPLNTTALRSKVAKVGVRTVWTLRASPANFVAESGNDPGLGVHSITAIVNSPMNMLAGHRAIPIDSYGARNLPVGRHPYTISLWVKPVQSALKGVFGWGEPSPFGSYNAIFVSTSGARNSWGNHSNLSFSKNEAIMGEWFHVAATFNGTVRTLYWNGVKRASDVPSPTSRHASTWRNAYVGKVNDELFDGFVDDLSVWSYALGNEDLLSTVHYDTCNHPDTPSVCISSCDGGLSISDHPQWDYEQFPLGNKDVIVGVQVEQATWDYRTRNCSHQPVWPAQRVSYGLRFEQSPNKGGFGYETSLTSESTCWVRCLSGCNVAISFTATPQAWFQDFDATDRFECADKIGEYNTACGRSDVEAAWGRRPAEDTADVHIPLKRSSPPGAYSISAWVKVSHDFASDNGLNMLPTIWWSSTGKLGDTISDDTEPSVANVWEYITLTFDTGYVAPTHVIWSKSPRFEGKGGVAWLSDVSITSPEQEIVGGTDFSLSTMAYWVAMHPCPTENERYSMDVPIKYRGEYTVTLWTKVSLDYLGPRSLVSVLIQPENTILYGGFPSAYGEWEQVSLTLHTAGTVAPQALRVSLGAHSPLFNMHMNDCDPEASLLCSPQGLIHNSSLVYVEERESTTGCCCLISDKATCLSKTDGRTNQWGGHKCVWNPDFKNGFSCEPQAWADIYTNSNVDTYEEDAYPPTLVLQEHSSVTDTRHVLLLGARLEGLWTAGDTSAKLFKHPSVPGSWVIYQETSTGVHMLLVQVALGAEGRLLLKSVQSKSCGLGVFSLSKCWHHPLAETGRMQSTNRDLGVSHVSFALEALPYLCQMGSSVSCIGNAGPTTYSDFTSGQVQFTQIDIQGPAGRILSGHFESGSNLQYFDSATSVHCANKKSHDITNSLGSALTSFSSTNKIGVTVRPKNERPGFLSTQNIYKIYENETNVVLPIYIDDIEGTMEHAYSNKKCHAAAIGHIYAQTSPAECQRKCASDSQCVAISYLEGRDTVECFLYSDCTHMDPAYGFVLYTKSSSVHTISIESLQSTPSHYSLFWTLISSPDVRCKAWCIALLPNVNLDFESLSSYSIGLKVVDQGGMKGFGPLIRDVLDVNEMPVITDSFTRAVPEDTVVGVHVGGAIQERDEDGDATFCFSEANGGNTNSAFRWASGLALTEKDSGCQLSVGNELDYETQAIYSLAMSIVDEHGLMGEPVILHVEIADVNEPPWFGQLLYIANINENSVMNTLFAVAVDVDDFDAGDLSQLSYTLDGCSPSSGTSAFHILDPSSGVISLTQGVDFEYTPMFNITFSVIDPGGLVATSTVQVHINDVNELHSIHMLPAYAVPENTANVVVNSIGEGGIMVPDAIYVYDQDRKINIRPTTASVLFSVPAETDKFAVVSLLNNLTAFAFNVVLKRAVDYEMFSSYELTIGVSDGAGVEVTANLGFNVIDNNDPPSFVLMAAPVDNSPASIRCRALLAASISNSCLTARRLSTVGQPVGASLNVEDQDGSDVLTWNLINQLRRNEGSDDTSFENITEQNAQIDLFALSVSHRTARVIMNYGDGAGIQLGELGAFEYLLHLGVEDGHMANDTVAIVLLLGDTNYPPIFIDCDRPRAILEHTPSHQGAHQVMHPLQTIDYHASGNVRYKVNPIDHYQFYTVPQWPNFGPCSACNDAFLCCTRNLISGNSGLDYGHDKKIQHVGPC
jgi:hypothetical protein